MVKQISVEEVKQEESLQEGSFPKATEKEKIAWLEKWNTPY